MVISSGVRPLRRCNRNDRRRTRWIHGRRSNASGLSKWRWKSLNRNQRGVGTRWVGNIVSGWHNVPRTDRRSSSRHGFSGLSTHGHGSITNESKSIRRSTRSSNGRNITSEDCITYWWVRKLFRWTRHCGGWILNSEVNLCYLTTKTRRGRYASSGLYKVDWSCSGSYSGSVTCAGRNIPIENTVRWNRRWCFSSGTQRASRSHGVTGIRRTNTASTCSRTGLVSLCTRRGSGVDGTTRTYIPYRSVGGVGRLGRRISWTPSLPRGDPFGIPFSTPPNVPTTGDFDLVSVHKGPRKFTLFRPIYFGTLRPTECRTWKSILP